MMINLDERMYDLDHFAVSVYEQMNGFYIEAVVPDVRDESKEGFIKAGIDAIYEARERLRRRFSIEDDDKDLIAIMDAAEQLCRACSLAMFRYGETLSRP